MFLDTYVEERFRINNNVDSNIGVGVGGDAAFQAVTIVRMCPKFLKYLKVAGFEF